MIKNSKNNESMPDFNDMMNEVEQDMVLQEAEESVIDKVPDLKTLNTNIENATATWVNATLQLESAIQQYQRAERKLEASVTTIRGKVDTINDHIDNVMENAPTKLHVSVSVSDPDMKKIQEMFDKEHEWVVAQMQVHLTQVNNMLIEEHRKTMERYKEYDGCYLGSRVQWFFWLFFAIGFSVVVGGIAMLIALHYGK